MVVVMVANSEGAKLSPSRYDSQFSRVEAGTYHEANDFLVEGVKERNKRGEIRAICRMMVR